MASDPFALIRKIDTGQSTSFQIKEHPEHLDDGVRVPEKASYFRKVHQEHLEHPIFGDGGEFAGEKHRATTYGDEQDRYLPDAWRAGMSELRSLPVPNAADEGRWAQIVRDAHRLAWEWHAEPLVAAWSLGDLFGFDPDDIQPAGLLLSIRGGSVGGFFDDRGRMAATIRDGERGQVRIFWRPGSSAAPIWKYRNRQGRW